MCRSAIHQKLRRRMTPWARFIAGALLLACAVSVLMQGYTPAGPAGDVFRNNLRRGIDATPLFYTEVESLVPDEQTETPSAPSAADRSCPDSLQRGADHAGE
jgi:hypothetical protein